MWSGAGLLLPSCPRSSGPLANYRMSRPGPFCLANRRRWFSEQRPRSMKPDRLPPACIQVDGARVRRGRVRGGSVFPAVEMDPRLRQGQINQGGYPLRGGLIQQDRLVRDGNQFPRNPREGPGFQRVGAEHFARGSASGFRLSLARGHKSRFQVSLCARLVGKDGLRFDVHGPRDRGACHLPAFPGYGARVHCQIRARSLVFLTVEMDPRLPRGEIQQRCPKRSPHTRRIGRVAISSKLHV